MRPTPLGWLVLALTILPWLAAFGAGVWWLWREGWALAWFLSMTASSLLFWAAQRWWSGRFWRLPPALPGNPDWPPRDEEVWTALQDRVEKIDPKDYPIDERLPHRLLDLGMEISLEVARRYHPEAAEPRLEAPAPELILCAEQVCRDLRHLVTQVPMSGSLTVNQAVDLGDWLQRYGPLARDVWRIGGLVINPSGALFNELRNFLVGHALSLSRVELQRWLLQSYAQRVARYAIDLYSGQLKTRTLPPPDDEPLRIAPLLDAPLHLLVLGQTNSGKSSLINALFGEVRTPADALPTPAGKAPYLLERDGLPAALIFDTQGYDQLPPAGVEEALDRADIILLACRANEAARGPDRLLLDRIRAHFHAHPERTPPPLMVVLTHIDRLSPAREWSPPYDIAHPATPKALAIRGALDVLAEELRVEPQDVVPVSLQPGASYNVEESLIPALLAHIPTARRSQYLRCLRRGEDASFWIKLGEGAARGGQWIVGRSGALLARVRK